MKKFTKTTLYKQLALTGLLGIGAFVSQNQAQAVTFYTAEDSNASIATVGLTQSYLGNSILLNPTTLSAGGNNFNYAAVIFTPTERGGNVQYKLNGHQENNDFGGDWWESALGLTAQINQKHNVYLEGQYATGRKFNQTQVNAGYRYSF